MVGKLKDGQFQVGREFGYTVPERGKEVQIVETEVDPIYGKRYKIAGHDEWFEENCFEYVKNSK